jgi:signal transduction histidine kinase/CheY-like chemotaxis protein/putative methionine-R-sulfoxide reductase with GAF domain
VRDTARIPARRLPSGREATARLLADAERRRRTAEALAATQRLITGSLDPAEVGQAICDSVRTLFGAQSTFLLRVERASQGLALVATAGELGPGLQPGVVIPPGIGFPDVALRERRAVQTQDLLSDPRVRLTEEFRARFAQAPDRAVLCLPLMAQGQVTGTLSIRDRAGRLFDAEEVSVAEAFASQAATALENARLFSESERQRRIAESLAQVSRMVSRSQDPVEVGRGICETVQRLLAAKAAALYRVEPGSGDLAGVVSSGKDGWGVGRPFVLPRGVGIVGLAAAERRLLFTPNVVRDPRLTITPELRARLEAASFRAALAVPLLVNGLVVGVLSIVDAEGRRFGADEVGLAQAFAAQAAVVWENARLQAEADRARTDIEMLAEVSRELAQTLDTDQVFGLILQHVRFIARADVAHIALVQEDGSVRPVTSLGGRSGACTLPVASGECGLRRCALETAQLHESADESGSLCEEMRTEGVHVALALPLRVGGRTVGLVCTGRRAPERFEAVEKSHLGTLSMSFASALENARLYRETVRQKNDLAHALRTQSEFLANTSHELKGPVVTIQALLDGIAQGLCTGPEEERAFLAEAHGCAEELKGAIDNVLTMARIEAGGIVAVAEPVDLPGLFAEIGALLRGRASTNPELTLAWQPPAAEPRAVVADPTWLRRVLLNVVGNSLKFTERGEVVVRAWAEPGPGVMRIEVCDTGIGVAPEQQPRLFQKFAQADGSASRRHGGSGLGLAIARHLMERMGGSIALASPGTGQGTTVTLTLPLAADASRAGDLPSPAEERGGAGGAGAGDDPPLILIVEDDSRLRDVLADFLALKGFRTAQADGVTEACAAALRLRPALLLTDLTLRDATSSLPDGVHLVNLVRRTPGLERLPAILHTAAPAEARALLRRTSLDPPVPVVEKPSDFAFLCSVIDRALLGARSEAGV